MNIYIAFIRTAISCAFIAFIIKQLRAGVHDPLLTIVFSILLTGFSLNVVFAVVVAAKALLRHAKSLHR